MDEYGIKHNDVQGKIEIIQVTTMERISSPLPWVPNGLNFKFEPWIALLELLESLGVLLSDGS